MIDKLIAGETVPIFINRRFAFANLLMWLAVCLLIYLAFSHVRGINKTEEIILLIFLAACVLRPFIRLCTPIAAVELSPSGVSYRGDYENYTVITRTEILKPKVALFSHGRLKLYTEIKEREEVAFDILAIDSALSLEELEQLITTAKKQLTDQPTNE